MKYYYIVALAPDWEGCKFIFEEYEKKSEAEDKIKELLNEKYYAYDIHVIEGVEQTFTKKETVVEKVEI